MLFRNRTLLSSKYRSIIRSEKNIKKRKELSLAIAKLLRLRKLEGEASFSQNKEKQR